MNGKALLKVIKEIKDGEYYSVWNILPDVASGEAWVNEIKDACDAIAERIDENEDYDLEEMRDWSAEYADNCASSSHKYMHDMNHELSLWASDDISAEAEDYIPETTDIKKLEQAYYYIAMRMTFDAVADQAHENAEELEEASA